MSRDALDMLLDEYDEWSTRHAEIREGDVITRAISHANAADLLVRLVGEVTASNRVLPGAGSATSSEGAPPIMLETLDAMQEAAR